MQRAVIVRCMCESSSISAISIRPCTMADIERAPHLIDEYGAESTIDGMGPQCPQFDTYYKLEAAGMIHITGAFHGDELVGFVIVLASILPHYGKPVATTESLFLAKAYRKGNAGLRLLRSAEQRAKEIGAVGILVSAPAGGQLERILPRYGYTHSNTVFFRGLA